MFSDFSIRSKSTLLGIAFGLAFPIFATTLDAFLLGDDMSLASMWRVQFSQPLHWVINTAPFVLGLMGYVIGRSRERINALNDALQERLNVRTIELKTANHDLTLETSEHLRTQAVLQSSEVKLQSITDSAQDAIIMIDVEGKISYWNPAAERIFGYTAQEVMGQLLEHSIVPERFRNMHAMGFARFRKAGQRLHEGTGEVALLGKTTELAALRKDGSEIPVEISLSGVRLDGNWHAVGILRDITERKISEARLLETSHAAEASNRAKSRFLASMSHEIRTPMSTIIGYSDLLRSTDMTATQQEYCQILQNSSEALLLLLNDILDFSKIEAGHLDMEQEPFVLTDVLDAISDMLLEKMLDSDIELVIDVAENVPNALVGDALRLRQVLLNLLGNAFKFTERGEVVLRVQCQMSSSAQATLVFEIRDTGIGMQQEVVQKLFQAFTQADDSTTRKYGGTGLGLAVCKQLVELMGGEIGVESELGSGSNFHFTAVFGRSRQEDAPLQLTSIKALRVLIVDDNVSNRTVMQRMLESFKWQVESASCAAEGLAALRRAAAKNPFDLVLIDWRMPDMDGLQTCEAIKADQQLAGVRIIMMSAFGRETQKDRAESLKLDAFLIKPIKSARLRDAVETIWGSRAHDDGGQQQLKKIAQLDSAQLFAGRRVLLVEDNAINRKLARTMLEKKGFRVDAVENGRLAVEAVRSTSYDLVLMDMQMPEMDGLEATRAIRSDSAFVDLPIIAMTANVMMGDKDLCLAAGMNDYLSKPISPAKFHELLIKWLIALGDAPTSAHSVESDVIDALAGLVGIEVPQVLESVGGDKNLLRELLVDFAQESANFVEQVQEALEQDDRQRAKNLVHSFKGVVGNLGANELYEAAVALETTIKLGHEQPVEQIAQVDRLLTDVLQGIARLQARA